MKKILSIDIDKHKRLLDYIERISFLSHLINTKPEKWENVKNSVLTMNNVLWVIYQTIIFSDVDRNAKRSVVLIDELLVLV